VVILELSSFQLELMTRSPQVSAILNITPNHLDRHGTMEAYAAAKTRILAFQGQQDTAVLNREDPGSWNAAAQVHGKLVSFGLLRPAVGQVGTFVENGQVLLQTGQAEQVLFSTSLIQLIGQHNQVNVAAACAIAYAAGFPVEAMIAGVAGLRGVAHRLEWVRSWKGAEWINSSIDTAPERTMAAIRSFDQPLVLLLGGRDKALPWGELADLVHKRVDHVVVFGEAAPKILQALGPAQTGRRPYTLEHCSGLQAAVAAAARVASEGDVVLLSPGGTSYDEFTDFEERGERFRQWVKQLS
jgi:UDP-N-acetylmuramoylalanine--D-glutamate ligase